MKLLQPFFARKSPCAGPASRCAAARDRECAWRLPRKTECGSDDVAAEIAAWVRARLLGYQPVASPERVALALTCRDSQGRIVHSDTLDVYDPALFVRSEGALRIAAFIADVRDRTAEDTTVFAVLLNLGDAAYPPGAASSH